MILKPKDNFDPSLMEQLRKYVYDIVGYMHAVYRELPCGLPEYVYQEALSIELQSNGIDPHKEYRHHPLFHGQPLNAFLKMDMMIEREQGNIIIECKAIEQIGPHERQQLVSYMIGTGFPIGILVNFATYPKAQIERYYYDKNDMTVSAF